MKKKFLILMLPLLTLFSCGNSDPYKDKIVKNNDNITCTGSIKTTYSEAEKDNLIDIGDLKVTFKLDGVETPIEYFDSDEEKIPFDKYFITTSDSSPTLGRIKKSGKLSTSQPSYTTKVYIALIHSDDKVYVRENGIEITIKNSKAINPVLYYVGSAVIFVAIGVLIYIIQKKKTQNLNTENKK